MFKMIKIIKLKFWGHENINSYPLLSFDHLNEICETFW